MKNALSEQRGNWVTNEINRLNRLVNELKYQQPVTIKESPEYQFGPYTIANNSYKSLAITLSTSEDKVVYILPQITIYKTSISNDNRYGLDVGSGNWTTAQINGFDVEISYDHHQAHGNNDQVVVLIMKNKTGGSLDIYFEFSARYIANTL